MFGRQDEKAGACPPRTSRGRVPLSSLPSLAAEFGDQVVELLKLDIEGSDYAVLGSLDPPALGVRVLCVEPHHTVPHE
jgi:FkbM family methyltransferase